MLALTPPLWPPPRLDHARRVHAQLVAVHVGERGAATSRPEPSKKQPGAARPTQHCRLWNGGVAPRAALVEERKREAATLAALQADRASVAARGRQIETEAAPIHYVAELLSADIDAERAIRWLILMMVLCCDPLAIALTAAASVRRATT
jgi:hypothetical protein